MLKTDSAAWLATECVKNGPFCLTFEAFRVHFPIESVIFRTTLSPSTTQSSHSRSSLFPEVLVRCRV